MCVCAAAAAAAGVADIVSAVDVAIVIVVRLHSWAQNGISRFGPTTRITQLKYNDQGSFICVEYNWSDFNFAKCNDQVLPQ